MTNETFGPCKLEKETMDVDGTEYPIYVPTKEGAHRLVSEAHAYWMKTAIRYGWSEKLIRSGVTVWVGPDGEQVDSCYNTGPGQLSYIEFDLRNVDDDAEDGPMVYRVDNKEAIPCWTDEELAPVKVLDIIVGTDRSDGLSCRVVDYNEDLDESIGCDHNIWTTRSISEVEAYILKLQEAVHVAKTGQPNYIPEEI